MKKILALLLALLMVFALCACGNKKGNCEVCGNSAVLHKRTVLGTDFYVCDSCENGKCDLCGRSGMLRKDTFFGVDVLVCYNCG